MPGLRPDEQMLAEAFQKCRERAGRCNAQLAVPEPSVVARARPEPHFFQCGRRKLTATGSRVMGNRISARPFAALLNRRRAARLRTSRSGVAASIPHNGRLPDESQYR
jgi:hypothetical protein